MISKRIREIGKMIDNQYSVIDIGCDHGYLAQILREQGNEQLIICADEKKGPLDNARGNLENYTNIEYCLSDGAKNVLKQTDVAVMAGMGHNTVEHIISDCPAYFNQCKKIVIEVNTQVDLMRSWLMNHHFKIVDEKIIHDYKYYEILVVEPGEMRLTDEEIAFGPVLLRQRSQVFIECWKKNLDKLKGIYDSLASDHPDALNLKNKIELIEAVLNQ